MLHCLANKYGQRPSTILRGSARDYVLDMCVLESGLEAEAEARYQAETDARHSRARGDR